MICSFPDCCCFNTQRLAGMQPFMQPCAYRVVKGRHILTQLHCAVDNHAGMCIVLYPSINFCYCSMQCQDMKERIPC